MRNSEKIRLGILLMTLCAGVAAVADEKPYDFRARLECVHQRDIRNTALTPAADEYVFAEGATIAIPADAGVVLKGAAEDFADYFKVSMLLTARVVAAGEGARSTGTPRRAAVSAAHGVTVAIDPSLGKGVHTVNVSKEGVRVAAVDERQAAQALYHLEDLMNLRRAPYLKFGAEHRETLFSPRMTHSAWGVDLYPDNYLRKIAHTGMDAIIIFLTEEDKTAGSPKGQDVADVIRRAAKVGLDTYLYWRDNFDQRAWVHPDDPKAAEGYDAVYGRITGKYPDAKGVIFVGESFSCPFKDPHVLPLKTWHRTPEFEGDTRLHPGWYPCLEYTKLVKAVSASIRKRNPKADFIFWTYNWCADDALEAPRLKMLENMQKDVSILSTFEFSAAVQTLPNGLRTKRHDYTLVFPGPSDSFAADAKCAHRSGLNLYAMTCTGGRTWDHGSIPYMPVPQLWKKRWDAVVKAHDEWGLSGLMEGHHMGAEPSIVNELEKEAYTRGGIPFEKHIRMICARDGVADRADRMVAAYAKWSEAQALIPPTLENQYSFLRNGPAFPFNALGPRLAGSLGDDRDKGDFPIDRTSQHGLSIIRFNYADDQLRQWREGLSYFPRRIPDVAQERAEIETMELAARLSAEGDALYADAIRGMPDDERGRAARRRAALGDYLTRTYRTGIHIKKATLLEDTVLDSKAAPAAKEAARREILKLARAEYRNAEGAIPSVRRDSMLGYEPSMCYVGGEEQIRWKLRKMVETYGPAVKGDVKPKTVRIPLDKDEHWWGAHWDLGGDMPLTGDTDYVMDLREDQVLQGVCSLFVSDRGRWVWCDDPCRFTFGGGAMTVEPTRAEVKFGKSGDTLADACRYASRTFQPPTGKHPDLSFFSSPQYCTWIELGYQQTQAGIEKYVEGIKANGFPPGVIMIDDTWQTDYGVWEFDPKVFPDPKGLCDRLHKDGFKIVLWACPFVSPDSREFRYLQSVEGILMAADRSLDFEGHPHAVLYNWWNGWGGVVDFTSPAGLKWATDVFQGLCTRYGIDGFKFDATGPRYFVMPNRRSYDPEATGADLSHAFGVFGEQFAMPSAGCWRQGGRAIVTRLNDKAHTWKEAHRCIGDMIVSGLIGCPFVLPDMVGGGLLSSFAPGKELDQDLFVRSAESQALSPMIQFSAAPWRVLDRAHLAAVKKAVDLRAKFTPKFTALAVNAGKTGEPILRSLEYVFPHQGYHAVRDEYLMGDDLLVVPMLAPGTRREAIIPPGTWTADDGTTVTGPTRLTLEVPLDRIPHFVRNGAL